MFLRYAIPISLLRSVNDYAYHVEALYFYRTPELHYRYSSCPFMALMAAGPHYQNSNGEAAKSATRSTSRGTKVAS
jgi:hypothetical protein